MRRLLSFKFFIFVALVAAPVMAQEVVDAEAPIAIPAPHEAEPIAPEMRDYPVVKLRSLDKVTARTKTFEAQVGRTLQFGEIYIKARACRKTAPIEQPESASFLQIWDYDSDDEPQWVFSGWMFASSPALSAMDHPIYDVWVLDCLDEQSGEADDGAVDEATPLLEPDVAE